MTDETTKTPRQLALLIALLGAVGCGDGGGGTNAVDAASGGRAGMGGSGSGGTANGGRAGMGGSGSGGTANGGSGGAANGGAGGDVEPPGCYRLADGTCVEETFHNPPVLAPDAQGVYQLELKPTEFTVDGKRHCGRGYNGLYPAPTIDVAAAADGQQRQVRVDLHNRFTHSDYRSLHGDDCTCADTTNDLSCEPAQGHGHGGADTCVCTDAEGAECHLFDFNVTNLHAHGSHVRPDFALGGGCTETAELKCRSCTSDSSAEPRACFHSDDVLTRVNPGAGIQHRWDLDEDGPHEGGLDWYHPHIHGSTAIQVASGATGALIIRGPVDALPGVQNARERVLVVMTPPVDYTPLADGQACDEDHLTFNDFPTLGDTSKKQRTLINGVHQPRMVMAPGQIERWRFLHGAFLDEVFIGLFHGKDSDCTALDLDQAPVRLTQIARDGITMPRPPGDTDWPFAPTYLFMSPGYRIEAMLDGSQLQDGETLCLMAGRFLQADTSGTTDEAVGLREPPTADQILQKMTNGDLISIVNVAESAGPPTETQAGLRGLRKHELPMMPPRFPSTCDAHVVGRVVYAGQAGRFIPAKRVVQRA